MSKNTKLDGRDITRQTKDGKGETESRRVLDSRNRADVRKNTDTEDTESDQQRRSQNMERKTQDVDSHREAVETVYLPYRATSEVFVGNITDSSLGGGGMKTTKTDKHDATGFLVFI